MAGDDRSRMDEQELTDAVRDGDVEAFRTLYERYRTAAARTARGVAPAQSADDLVAEAFAVVFAALRGGGGPRDNFGAYLNACVRRTAQRWAERHRLDPIEDVEGSAGRVLLPEPEAPEEEYLVRSEHAIVRTSFAALPDHYRYALWLVDIHGASYREAAARMGISTTLVQSVLKSARRALSDGYVATHLRAATDGVAAGPEADRASDPTHPSSGDLARYARGRLRAGKRSDIAAHLAGCARCELRLQEAESVGSTLRGALVPGLLVPLVRETAGRSGMPWQPQLAALLKVATPVVLLVVVSGLLFAWWGTGSDEVPAAGPSSGQVRDGTDPAGADPTDSIAPTAGPTETGGPAPTPADPSSPTNLPTPSTDPGSGLDDVVIVPGVRVAFDPGTTLDGAVAGEVVPTHFTLTADAALPAGAELRITVPAGVALAAPYGECDWEGTDLVCPNIGGLAAGVPVRGDLMIEVLDPQVATLPALRVTMR